jgi:hypothetical protein
MRRGSVILLCFLLAALGGAGCRSDPREELLREVFAALGDRDARRFQARATTLADFDLEAQGVSPFKAGMTYAGSVLRPEEESAQRAQFEQALRGGPGCIDFSRDRFAGLGTLLAEGTQETLGGTLVPYQVYSVRIRRGGEEIDARDLHPRFAITPRSGGFRMLGLVLPAEESR